MPTVYGKLPFTASEQVCVTPQFRRDNPMYGVVAADNNIYIFLDSERAQARAYFEGLPSFSGWVELDASTSMVSPNGTSRTEFYLPTYFPYLQVGDPGYPAPVSLHPGVLTIGPYLVPMTILGGNLACVNGTEASTDDILVINGVDSGQVVHVNSPCFTLTAGAVLTVRVKNTLNTECWGRGYLCAKP